MISSAARSREKLAAHRTSVNGGPPASLRVNSTQAMLTPHCGAYVSLVGAAVIRDAASFADAGSFDTWSGGHAVRGNTSRTPASFPPTKVPGRLSLVIGRCAGPTRMTAVFFVECAQVFLMSDRSRRARSGLFDDADHVFQCCQLSQERAMHHRRVILAARG